jgi:hypothetical protein
LAAAVAAAGVAYVLLHGGQDKTESSHAASPIGAQAAPPAAEKASAPVAPTTAGTVAQSAAPAPAQSTAPVKVEPSAAQRKIARPSAIAAPQKAPSPAPEAPKPQESDVDLFSRRK